jgi:L-ribulokinase
VYTPQAKNVDVYEELYQLYRRVYFAFGDEEATPQSLADVLRNLREIAARVR